jgi:processive 1,2-diacylglycerol beta-glucosyltransferase
MAVSRVLILTAGFGEGHNAAARNLRDALLALGPQLRVEMRDIFAEAYPRLTPLCVRGYLHMINRLPHLWQLVFDWLDRSSAVADRIGIFGAAARRLASLLDDFRPEVIVSTYPGCNHLLDHLHAKGRPRDYRHVTIITDSLTINRVWITGHSDVFIVANEPTAEVVRGLGVPPEKLRVGGFPVPAFFAQPRPPKTPPAGGEKWRVLFMVNSGRHLAIEAVRHLLTLDNIALTVTVGRDAALEQSIRALGAAEVFGWTKELPRLMAEAHLVVSKAGGATVQECLAAATPMLVSQVVPGQEEGNARLIAEAGAGALATNAEAITQAVRDATADGGALWSQWHAAAQSLGHPHAAREIAEWILAGTPSEALARG